MLFRHDPSRKTVQSRPSSTSGGKTKSVSVLAIVAMLAGTLMTVGCAKPQSPQSVSGTYVVNLDQMLDENGYDLADLVPDGTSTDIELTLDEDGKGSFGIPGDDDEKAISWKLSGSSKNLDVLITLAQPVTEKDKWAAFLLMLESDPSGTKIKGKVSDGEIRINHKDPDKPHLVFTKVDEE